MSGRCWAAVVFAAALPRLSSVSRTLSCSGVVCTVVNQGWSEWHHSRLARSLSHTVQVSLDPTCTLWSPSPCGTCACVTAVVCSVCRLWLSAAVGAGCSRVLCVVSACIRAPTVLSGAALVHRQQAQLFSVLATVSLSCSYLQKRCLFRDICASQRGLVGGLFMGEGRRPDRTVWGLSALRWAGARQAGRQGPNCGVGMLMCVYGWALGACVCMATHLQIVLSPLHPFLLPYTAIYCRQHTRVWGVPRLETMTPRPGSFHIVIYYLQHVCFRLICVPCSVSSPTTWHHHLNLLPTPTPLHTHQQSTHHSRVLLAHWQP